jgi:hypothetical protein
MRERWTPELFSESCGGVPIAPYAMAQDTVLEALAPHPKWVHPSQRRTVSMPSMGFPERKTLNACD